MKELIAEDLEELARNLGQGRAAYYIAQLVSSRFWPAPTDWQSDESQFDQLVGRIGFFELSADEDFREARRLSPQGTDRMMRGVIENLRRRSDPIATFAAIQLGVRDPELINRARSFLEKLRSINAQEVSPEVEDDYERQKKAEREIILKKWLDTLNRT